MPRIDLRAYKARLRQRYRAERAQLTPPAKQRMDGEILRRVTHTRQYRACRLVMVYVSTPIEVDTRGIIRRAFADGKRVAVPRCIPGTREMEFHEIRSMSELSPGTFGVLEPAEDAPVIQDFSDAFLIAPALAIDSFGYRLGYGGGYYDRYLARFDGRTAGICYASGYRYRINHGRFDCPLELIITERFVRLASDEPPRNTGEQKESSPAWKSSREQSNSK